MGTVGPLTPGWITLQGRYSTDAINATPNDYVDCRAYSNLMVQIAPREFTGTPTVHIQTAPVNDEDFWVDVASQTITSTSGSILKSVFATAATPIASMLRYRVTATADNWSLTFKAVAVLKNG